MINLGTIALCIIMLLLIGHNTLKKAYINFFILTIVVELMIERGFFIQIGEQQIAYRTVCEAGLTVFSVVTVAKMKLRIKKKQLYSYFACSCVLVAGWIGLYFIPSAAKGATLNVSWDDILMGRATLQSIRFIPALWKEIIQVIMFFITAFVAYASFDKEDWKLILYKFVKFSRILLLFGIPELITKYVFHSTVYIDILDSFLGRAVSSEEALRVRGTGYTLFGLTREASHYVFVLSILFIIYCTYYNLEVSKKEKKITCVSISFILIMFVFSMSFSSLYYGVCLLLLVWIFVTDKNKKLLRTFGVVASGTVVVCVFPIVISKLTVNTFLGRRILSVVEEWGKITNGTWLTSATALEWSNRVRLGSTYETIRMIKYRPLFGLGLAAETAHSSLAMLIAGCGILGTVLYLNVFFWGRKADICTYDKNTYLSLCVIYLLMNLFNSLGLRPFYECWSVVVCIAFQYLAHSSENPIFSIHNKENRENISTSVIRKIQ